ncbi:WecB/TagA/CpsF family glycosyltransferase [Amorphus coralli]|uniref:WecB/TagA/CpsF family glycosyltransferase n=1 Tax=Amorphus coralli TaxID=340680 RepID=UPI000379D0F3|nr:WecB/TagA/CpsF family glycosyltransferase [Amorphus coralli]
MGQLETVRLFGIDVAVKDFAGAIAQIVHWAHQRPARTVFTCNLDHVVKLRSDRAFGEAYAGADLVVADGMPFVWLARTTRTPLPARISGSELIVPLCRTAAHEGLTVFLLGSTEERLTAAEEALREAAPDLVICGRHAPPFGFRDDPEAQHVAAEAVSRVSPDILFVALGPPTQEIWVETWRETLDCGVALCIGAGLDFLSGDIEAAPTWMRRTGLEWVWRTLQEPRRLAPRYGRILALAPLLLKDHFLDRRKRRGV